MSLQSITGVPIIAILCYLLIEGIKIIFGKNEKIKELLPVISAILGGIFGILFYKLYPEIVPVQSYINSLIIGICSGLSATGSNQIWKRLRELFNLKNESGEDK